MCLANTNEAVVAAMGKEVLIDLVYQRLAKLADMPQNLTALEMVEQGYTDPVRLFVKNELHSQSKMEEGRMRLIMATSIVDQLVERVLHGAQNRLEIQQVAEGKMECPSMPGMGLHDEGLRYLIARVRRFFIPVSTDVSGWDWGVQGWMLDMDVECRVRLTGADYTLARIMRARQSCLGLSVLVASDGVVYLQNHPGVMKSGSYLTSSTNSRMRVMLSQLAGVDAIMVMGDDAVEEYTPGAVNAYAGLGVNIKMYQSSSLSEGVEFCAHQLRDTVEGCVPERGIRMLAGFLQKKPRDSQHANELLCAFEYDLRHDPSLQAYRDAIVVSRWGCDKDGEGR